MAEDPTRESSESGFWDAMKVIFLDRLSSPIISTYMISWSITNYQVLLIVFGKGEVEGKLKLLNQYFDGLTITIPWARAWIYGMPLLVTIAYIYIYPWINERVMPKVQKDNFKLQEIKDRVYYKNIVEVRDQRITELMTEKVNMEQSLETLKGGIESERKRIAAYKNQVKDFEARIGSLGIDPTFRDGSITMLMIYTILLKAHITNVKANVLDISAELVKNNIDLRAYNAVLFTLQKTEVVEVIEGITSGEEQMVFTPKALSLLEKVGYPTEAELRNKRI